MKTIVSNGIRRHLVYFFTFISKSFIEQKWTRRAIFVRTRKYEVFSYFDAFEKHSTGFGDKRQRACRATSIDPCWHRPMERSVAAGEIVISRFLLEIHAQQDDN